MHPNGRVFPRRGWRDDRLRPNAHTARSRDSDHGRQCRAASPAPDHACAVGHWHRLYLLLNGREQTFEVAPTPRILSAS